MSSSRQDVQRDPSTLRSLRAWALLQASSATAVTPDQVRSIVMIIRTDQEGADRDQMKRAKAS